MKLTKQQLRQIIKEELENVLEGHGWDIGSEDEYNQYMDDGKSSDGENQDWIVAKLKKSYGTTAHYDGGGAGPNSPPLSTTPISQIEQARTDAGQGATEMSEDEYRIMAEIKEEAMDAGMSEEAFDVAWPMAVDVALGR